MTVTVPKSGEVTETKTVAASTGRRILIVAVFIISGLVLLLSLAAVVGAWAGRSAVIDLVTEFTTGVDQLAGGARNGIAELDGVVVDVRQVVGNVQAAADQAAQNVSDEGLLLTLLPPDAGAQLESLATRIRTTADSIITVLTAASDFVEAVRALPFVDVPQAEEVSAIEGQVQGIRADVEQLASDVRQFRENTAAEIARVSATAAQIDAGLDNTQQDLAAIDGKLTWLQDTANYIQERFPLWMTISTLLLTGFLLWICYGMIHLMRAYGRQWHASVPTSEAVASPPMIAGPAEPTGLAGGSDPTERDKPASPAAVVDESAVTAAIEDATIMAKLDEEE